MSLRARRLAAAALGTAGFLDAVYMLSYDEGLLPKLWCPFFGEQCEKVGRSRHARHIGIPNAVVGGMGYGAMAMLALWDGIQKPSKRPLKSFAFAGMSAVFAGASAYLMYEQKAKVHAYCFWCITSTAISAVLLPLGVMEGIEAITDKGRSIEPRGKQPIEWRKARSHWSPAAGA